jgi:hypothetical protein
MTTDYEPLVVKQKLKELETKIAQLEAKIEILEQGSTRANGNDLEQVGTAKKMSTLTDRPELKNSSPDRLRIDPPAKATPTDEPSVAAFEPKLPRDQLIASIEQKGAFVVRNSSGAPIEVDLTDASLTPEEFSELAGLKELEKLVLAGANTPPSIYETLFHLKQLKHLEFERATPTRED